MNIIGNIFLTISVIIFLVLCKISIFTKAPRGDYGVGHAMLTGIGLVAFATCFIVLCVIVVKHGGLDWISPSPGQRTKYMALGLLFVLVANLYMSRYVGGSSILPIYVGISTLLIPILLLFSAGILLNYDYKNISSHLYKTPIYASLIISGGGIVLALLSRIIRW